MNSFQRWLYAISLAAPIYIRSFISLVIILLIHDYTVTPGVFIVKKADSLLIRPKGDWSSAFTYSTSAMNYTTLLYGLTYTSHYVITCQLFRSLSEL